MVIKPVNQSNLKTTNEIEFKCKRCGCFGKMYFENFLINTDSVEVVKKELKNLNCPKCGGFLLEKIILD